MRIGWLINAISFQGFRQGLRKIGRGEGGQGCEAVKLYSQKEMFHWLLNNNHNNMLLYLEMVCFFYPMESSVLEVDSCEEPSTEWVGIKKLEAAITYHH